MTYNNNITLNGVVLNILNLTPRKSQKKIKQVVGKTLVQNEIIGLDIQQWELDLSGIVLADDVNSLETNRANLEALDSTTSYEYIDGLHNSNYFVVPGSLQFEDNGEEIHSFYRYSIKIIEE